METSNIQINEIKYKNYSFITASYFGYEILINDEDKYINITKLLNLINEEHRKNNKPIKNFYELIRYEDFKEFEQELKDDLTKIGTSGKSQELKLYYNLNNVSNEFKGTYIHEDLINYVLMWADKKYAIKISRILKELNNNNIKRVQELTEELKNQNIEILNQNKKLIDKLKETREKSIYEQTDELSNNSKIKLYRLRRKEYKLKDEDIYKLSYDQDKDLNKDIYELKEVFTVNSASNILKSEGLKQYYNKGIRQFDKSNYDFVINYIKPSMRVTK